MNFPAITYVIVVFSREISEEVRCQNTDSDQREIMVTDPYILPTGESTDSLACPGLLSSPLRRFLMQLYFIPSRKRHRAIERGSVTELSWLCWAQMPVGIIGHVSLARCKVLRRQVFCHSSREYSVLDHRRVERQESCRMQEIGQVRHGLVDQDEVWLVHVNPLDCLQC